MGNSLCGRKSLGSGPPTDTTNFLNAIIDQESQDQENRVPFYWEKDFRNFLRDSNQDAIINSLEFCLEVLRLQVLREDELQADSKKIKEDIRAARLEKMQNIGHIYFKVNSKQCLSMTNQVMMEELGGKLRSLTVDKLEEANRELLAAKSDSRIWKSGLDFHYGKYLSTKPTQKMTAVILSIL